MKTVHPDILKLGWVSFLTDLSTEMIFSVFAIFFTSVAGASTAWLGLIEGLADFSASSLNYLAGWLSDRSGQRRVFVLAGYGFSTLAKTILLVSTSVAGLGAFRVIERLGKGFRGPPRDAWLAAIADKAGRGFAFGVHKALDKAGAVLGPLLAYALLRFFGETASGYRTLFWIACIPALLSLLLLTKVQDRPAAPRQRERLLQNWQALSPGFKRFLLPAGIFALGYYSLGFLLLKAHQLGLGIGEIVLLYAMFNLTCVIAAPLLGRLGDRIGRSRVLLLGYAIYLAINLGAIWVTTPAQMAWLFAVYGCFYAIDDAQSKAFIVDLEPDRSASAVGIYNFVTGCLYLPASLLAGLLWTQDPAWVFALAATLSMAAMFAFLHAKPAP